MENTANNRKAWVVFLLGSIGTPLFSFCYVNRGLYALISLALLILIPICNELGLISHKFASLLSFVVYIIGITISISLVEKIRNEPLKWYATGFGLGRVFAYAVIFFGILFYFRNDVYHPYKIASSSMVPNLMPRSVHWGKMFAYTHAVPERGDIIVFKSSKDPEGVDYVKRVVGLAGDKVQIKTGSLFINDMPVEIKQVEDFSDLESGKEIPQFLETLPGGQSQKILIMSKDGPIDNTPIYIVPSNSYFVLGDNRSYSIDSRDSQIGFVPAEDIKGKISD